MIFQGDEENSWFSDVTGKTYYNTTRAKAEQYEAASERMRKTPSAYKGWTAEGRAKADMGDIGIDVADVVESQSLDTNNEEWISQMEKYLTDASATTEEDFDFDNIPDYIDYDDLPHELKDLLHDDGRSSDDDVKGALIEALSNDGWNGINVASLKNDTISNFELLSELSVYY